MRPDRPFQVGLSGGIGSGKSTVARIFSMLGVPVYESDYEAKKLYFLPEVRTQIEDLLGSKAYLSPTQIDRKWIAGKLFGNAELREKINAILHPAVGRHYADWLESQNHPYVLKVAALLFEADIYKTLDQTILVTSPIELRIGRIRQRDPQRSEEEIRKIIQSQMSDEDKIALANGIILNDERHSLIEQVVKWNNQFSKIHSISTA